MNRNHQLDFLRAIAIILVLIIHSSTRYAETEIELFIGGWFSTIARPCIAIFLFISGALYKTSNGFMELLNKRVKRVVYPYLFFSFFAIIYTYKADLNIVVNDLGNVLTNILLANTFGIYYFVFIITCIYLLAFCLDKIGILEKYIVLIVIVTLIVNLLHGIYFNSIAIWYISEPWKTIYLYRSLLIWFPFFFLGISFKRYNLYNTIINNKILFRSIWLLVFIYWNYLYFHRDGNIDGYNSVIGTVFSTATILLLLSFNIRLLAFDYISKITYLIYLSHIFFIYAMRDIGIFLSAKLPFWFSFPSLMISLIGSILVYNVGKLIFRDRSYYIIGAQ